ncbi:MAG: OmpA family protein [Deltaproteobacteria bacterium]|nr:OmpA family protein [Deltaproteobacteria bacterium]
MKKRKKKEAPSDANTWITTFTNLMILLLAFFIVLVNLAVVDNQKKQLALNSLFGSFGFHMGGQSAIGKDMGSDITMPDAPLVKGEINVEQLHDIAMANGLGSDVSVRKEPEKTVIILSNKVLFDDGSHEIPPGGTRFLADLSKYLKDGTGLIELRGYVEQKEVFDDPDPARSSIYLSAKRALAVLHFFTDNGDIPITRIIAHGFGISPVKDQASTGQKDWQRQVEIIVNDQEKIPYRLRVNKEEDHTFDFKGFIFTPSRSHKE